MLLPDYHIAETNAIESLDLIIKKHEDSIRDAMQELEKINYKIKGLHEAVASFKYTKELLEQSQASIKLDARIYRQKPNLGQVLATYIVEQNRPMKIGDLKVFYEEYMGRLYERKNFASRIAEAINQRSLFRVLVNGDQMLVPFEWVDGEGFLKLEHQEKIKAADKAALNS